MMTRNGDGVVVVVVDRVRRNVDDDDGVDGAGGESWHLGRSQVVVVEHLHGV